MATINFPENPQLNDTYTFLGRTWIYNGIGWVVKPDDITAFVNKGGDTMSGKLTITSGGLSVSGTTSLEAIETSSQTLVDNLNADFLDGQEGAFYRNASNLNAGTLALLYGGTGSTTAAGARTNLGAAALAGDSAQDFNVKNLSFAAGSVIYPRAGVLDWYLGKFDGSNTIQNAFGASGYYSIGKYISGVYTQGISLKSTGEISTIASVTATSFIKTGGLSTQFLMADGSVDTYGTTAGSVAEGNHNHTFAALTSKPTTLSGYGITDAVQINSDNWANFRYTEFALADKDVIIDAQGSIKLDGWYSISVGTGHSYGTRLTINGLLAHDKTQLYFNGVNGSIQYRKSWYYNTPWTSFRTLWDSDNLTSLSQLTNDTGFITSNASITGNASSATKVNNNLVLKFDTGTTEGISLYTFDGSSAKTIDIKAGSNVSISKAAGIITISSTDTNTVYTHPTTSGNKHIPSGGSSGQILRWNSDGTAEWGADNNNTYSAATTTNLGLTKLFSDTVQSIAGNTVTATASRTYGVQVNSSGQLVVNVPWVDTDTTYSNFTGATAYVAGTAGLVPAPTIANYSSNCYLKSDGTWTQVNYSDLTGTVPNAPSATYASAVTLTADNSTNATNYPLFVNVATGNLSPRTDTGFTYNPSTGALTANTFIGELSGNASSATNLQTARTFAATGDATGSVSSNLSAGFSMALTLANSGVTAGTYKSVTVDAKGRVTAGTNPTTLADYGITDALLASTYTAANVLAKLITVDGHSSGIDADTVDGKHVTTSGWWDKLAYINASDGVMEVGAHIDFHEVSTGGADYAGRLSCYGGSPLWSGNTMYHSGNFTPGNYVLKAGDTMTGQLNVNSSIYAYGFYESSDRRLKTNIKELDPSLATNINLVEFDKQGEHGYGVIAQEVEQYYPALVKEGTDGYKTVNYIELAMIKIKYLENKIKKLEQRLWEKDIIN